MAFPDGFLWGTASSSLQCEGVAPAADWSAWERDGRVPRSHDGNGFGTRFAEDFRLLAEHGLTHHRLSIDWARIEPQQGRRDRDAIEHYREVLRAARDAGIAIWVCLHHFALPGWFADDEGGFLDDRARSYYWPRHVDFVAETFGDLVHGWKPINEPFAYAAMAYRSGDYPPGRRDPGDFRKAFRNVLLAGHDAARLLRGGGQPVASIHNLSPVHAAPGDEARRRADRLDAFMWRSWIGMVRDGILEVPGLAPVENEDFTRSYDLVGFSYYSATTVNADGSSGPYPADARIGPMGYAPWSEGLRLTLERLADELPGRPLLICEHGIGTTDDSWRVSFLRDSLDHVEQAIADGVDVRGFFHWTSVDNYEWHRGFEVPFGLFDRDRNAKDSAALVASYALRPDGR